MFDGFSFKVPHFSIKSQVTQFNKNDVESLITNCNHQIILKTISGIGWKSVALHFSLQPDRR